MNVFVKTDKALISLAIKCRLVPEAQENTLLDALTRKKSADPGYTAERMFTEGDILSAEEISFLLAVRDHLEMKMLDKKFGELGVANQFIRPESVKKALDIQSSLFKETSQSKLIGDILLENREISKGDKAAILLTQDRIKEELLADALNDIAATEIEQLTMNMRFGAIAVKKGYITIDQLNRALAVQKADADSGKPKKYLGAILKELFDLPDQTLNRILNIQKELEKKRLSLAQALERYNSETNVNKRLAGQFEYRFDKNKLAAHLIQVKEGFEDVRAADLKRWLHTIGITWGIVEDSEIRDFISGNTPGMEIQIARGRPPVPGRDARLEFFFDTDAGKSKAGRSQVPAVKKGEALARIIPPEAGSPGRDVSGLSIAPPPPKSLVLNCGEGVVREKDLFIAQNDGIPILYRGRTLFVKPEGNSVPTRYHTGDINTDLGDTYADAHLKVEGSILENGIVRCRNLEVSGRILGRVSAAGHLTARGDIGSEDAGPGSVQIKAEGDITTGKTVSNAILITGKSLKAPNADLSATAVQAVHDIVVKNVLDSGSTPCVLQTGKTPDLKGERIAARIKARTGELNGLRCVQELEELEAWLREKLAVRDAYGFAREYLNFVLALIEFPVPDGETSLQDRLEAVRTDPEKWPDLPRKPEPVNPGCLDYERSFLKDTRQMSLPDLAAYAREQADLKYGMYRAAVNASRRYTHKYEARKKEIEAKVAASQPKIEALEAAIARLTIQKDSLALSRPAQPVPPAVRVKNKTARGTVIKSINARLTVDRDIYGVKFVEGSQTDLILIRGYYDQD